MTRSREPSRRGQLGDFEIVREIARGGMGIVYEARQISLNRKVALKALAGSLGLTLKAVVWFRREAEAAAKTLAARRHRAGSSCVASAFYY